MANFPMGPGRRVMLARAPAQSVDANAFGVQSARALEQLGNTGAHAALQVMADQTREARIEADRKNQLADAADRQRQLLTLNETKDKLRDAHDEVVNGVMQGTIPKDQADAIWAERSKTMIGEAGGQFSEHFRDLASRDLASTGLILGNSVRKARETRDRQDVTSGIDQTLEYAQRQYKVDPVGASRMAADTLAQLGPFSAYNPQQIAAKGQAWKEGVQFTQGYEAVSAGRNDRKALDSAEKLIGTLQDLDPQKRATLMDRAQAYRLHLDQQDEMKAQRAQREWERRMTQAEKSYNVMRDMADKGTVLDPAYVDDVIRHTQGTPYQAGIVALAKQAKETGGFAAQPIAVQRATLQALDADIAKNGRTPELDKRREQLAKVLAGSEGDLAKEGLQAGLQRGVITSIEPLNLAGGIAGLSQQLAARSEQAATVQAWAGRPVSPFTKPEADNVAGLLRTMPADQRATALEVIAGRMTPQQAQAFAAQMDGSDKATALALAYGARQTTFDRPVSELILRGQIALKEAKTVKLDDKAEEGLTSQLDKALGGAIANPQQAQQVRDAAKLIWAGKASEGNRIDPENALRLALGGHVVEHNGAKVVTSLNVDSGELQQRLAKYPEAALTAQLPDGKVYVRGQPVEAAAFLKTLPGAKLRTLARDRFAVMSGEAFVLNSQAVPVVLEVGNAR